VYEVAGYDVYRKTVDGHQVKLVPLNNRQLTTNRFDDIVSNANEFKKGVEYTYTVVMRNACTKGLAATPSGTLLNTRRL
jgi:hypothetical protein